MWWRGSRVRNWKTVEEKQFNQEAGETTGSGRSTDQVIADASYLGGGEREVSDVKFGHEFELFWERR